jgi:hypothetical protein
MAHFAKVINGKVVNVVVAEPEWLDTFVDTTPGEWIQTSYNTRGGVHYDPETGEPSSDQTKALRKNFAGKGMDYDREKDAFIPVKPFESWNFNETTCLWDAPVEIPADSTRNGGEVRYNWNEETQTWDAVTE